MRTAQSGDRVTVHYVKRLQDGAVSTSRRRAPLELTVGIDHPRLPGLGAALVGLAPGGTAVVYVAAGLAYGPTDPGRVRRWPRARFPEGLALPVGGWVRAAAGRGGSRLVRILEVKEDTVVVDTNRRGAGQAMKLEVELIGIQPPEASPGAAVS